MWKKCYLHQQCEAELVHPLHTFSLAAQVTKWRTFPLKFQRRNKKKLSVRQSDLLENERLVSESSDCICVSEDRLGLFQGLSRVFHFFFLSLQFTSDVLGLFSTMTKTIRTVHGVVLFTQLHLHRCFPAYCQTARTCNLKVINPSKHSQNQSQLRD